MKERIQKILANAGVDSRRNIEEMVRQGRIHVNGKKVWELPVLVDPQTDKIEVDGQLMRLKAPSSQRRHYFILNKPRGVYSTNVAQGAQVRAIDLLPKNLRARLYPVGRLDAESKGLLLLTNDGELTNRLTHPKFGVPKTYRAVVDGIIEQRTLQQVEQGMWLADKGGQGFKTGRSHIRIAHRSRQKTVLEITVREGSNVQIRRMLAKFGHKVRDLTRTKMGPLTLDGLSPGQFRPLTEREIRLLQKSPMKHPQKEM
ncbi:MAG TPA: pseudouridine synthase [Tepidisphaeraceae bacterium]|nr:pseudouridine synthase [Tepidisphaeraceae bacterium]